LGWFIGGDGSAEFNALVVRGRFQAGILNTNVTLENSRFPGRHFPTALFGMLFALEHRGRWNNTPATPVNERTAIKVGAGAAAVQNVTLLSGSGARFFGIDFVNSFYGGATAIDAKRVATDGQTTFLAMFRGQVTGSGPAAILYRIHPTSVFPPPPNDTTTIPWVLQNDGFASQPFQPFFCSFVLTIPAAGWVEFGLCPLDDAGQGDSSKDVMTKAQLVMTANNF
jgi:hypothetical protein